MYLPAAKPASRPDRPALRVGFVLLPRFTLMPFAGIIDVLRLAADEGDRSRPITCSWKVMAPRLTPIRSSSGIEIKPTNELLPPGDFDYIVVVGGLLKERFDVEPAILDYLKSAAAAGVALIGVCTGSFALVRAGLMDGYKCCVSWFHYQDLIDEFPDVVPVADQLFVVDGNRITCAGGGGAIDLAAWLVDRHIGHPVAQKSLHILLIDRARPPGTPQPQAPTSDPSDDERVRRAVLLIEQHLEDPLIVEELAARVGLSARQLHRLFMREFGIGPRAFGLRYRLEHGRAMLLSTRMTVAEIAMESGFSDASHFHRAFCKAYGTTPAASRPG
jgi:transcriptional regulator GlxA family with amidase domain